MATKNQLNSSLEELPLTTTGEPTDQLSPEDDEDLDDAEFDETPLADDDEDLDEDEVSRLFPGENSYTQDEEPYEGIRKESEDDDLVDDNMTGMPVVPSPS